MRASFTLPCAWKMCGWWGQAPGGAWVLAGAARGSCAVRPCIRASPPRTSMGNAPTPSSSPHSLYTKYNPNKLRKNKKWEDGVLEMRASGAATLYDSSGKAVAKSTLRGYDPGSMDEGSTVLLGTWSIEVEARMPPADFRCAAVLGWWQAMSGTCQRSRAGRGLSCRAAMHALTRHGRGENARALTTSHTLARTLARALARALAHALAHTLARTLARLGCPGVVRRSWAGQPLRRRALGPPPPCARFPPPPGRHSSRWCPPRVGRPRRQRHGPPPGRTTLTPTGPSS